MSNVINLVGLYKTYFNATPFSVNKDGVKEKSEEVNYTGLKQNNYAKDFIHYTKNQIALNKVGLYGRSIWFPVTFWKSTDAVLEIDACTINVQLSKNIVKTAVSERKGTVKEHFSIEDYKFTIKGFLIGKDRKFPEAEILALKDLFETQEPVSLHGGYPELFLDKSCQIVINTLDFPEVQGKAHWIRPFSLTCESDFIDDLILE
ncbi:hypothetical protein BWK59_05865 [Flavobacterium davisii]|uniref:DUF6046 domain-containing protein n=1 Tax=Flavobacterium davisii TaxID=2906077 RepID=A0A2D0AIK6_9FLAO|nr:DUF6046 domain-containing protein [Flavobacterium davisii]OWP84349.1 hypothetical protein BWK59_05865 [Flavobacterium davisii]